MTQWELLKGEQCPLTVNGLTLYFKFNSVHVVLQLCYVLRSSISTITNSAFNMYYL